ncbi:MAG: hypothetical protein ACI38A_04170 [Candidatus Ornithomonoglobus sp.]
MNSKKFVSSISAFAIAASAFAGLAVTASAATTTLYERGYDTAWSEAADKAEWTGNYDSITVNGLTTGSGNGSRSLTHSITAPALGSIVTINAQWYTSTTTGSSSNYSYLNLGNNISFRVNQQDQVAALYVGDTAYTMAGFCVKDVNRTNDTWTISMVVDTATNTITSVSATSALSSTATYSNTNIILPSGTTLSSIAFGSVRASGTIGGVALKAISVVETTQDVTTADYTVKYVDGDGNEIKTASTRTNVVGNSISLSDEDTASFTADGQKYIYVSDDVSDKTVAEDGSTVVKVTFRAAATYNYSVVTSLGTTLAAGSAFEEDIITTAYPLYINNNGTLYTRAAESSQYKHSFTLSEDNHVETLNYTATDITNVVYYSEAEDVTGLEAVNSGNISARSSQAYAAYATKDTTLTTLPAGKYKVYGVVFAGSSAGVKLSFTLGDNNFNFSNTGSSNWVNVVSEEFNVADNTDLVFKASGAANAALDFIYVVKTGDYEAPVTPAAVSELAPVKAPWSTGDGTYAEAFTFTVTPNDQTVTSVNVAVEGQNDSKAFAGGVISGGGSAIFGIIATADAADNLPDASAFTVTLDVE